MPIPVLAVRAAVEVVEPTEQWTMRLPVPPEMPWEVAALLVLASTVHPRATPSVPTTMPDVPELETADESATTVPAPPTMPLFVFAAAMQACTLAPVAVLIPLPVLPLAVHWINRALLPKENPEPLSVGVQPMALNRCRMKPMPPLPSAAQSRKPPLEVIPLPVLPDTRQPLISHESPVECRRPDCPRHALLHRATRADLMPSPLGCCREVAQQAIVTGADAVGAFPLEASTTTQPAPSATPALPLSIARTFTRTPETAVFSVTTPLPGQLRTVPLRMTTLDREAATRMPKRPGAPLPTSSKPPRSSVTLLTEMVMPFPPTAVVRFPVT